MPDFVTLSCPTCGGQLQITEGIDRFACAHCGNEHLVKRGGGIIMLAPVVSGLANIQRGTDRTAIELTIRRLKEEIAELDREILKLARDALDRDFYKIAFGFSDIKRLTRRDRRGLTNMKNIDRCAEVIAGLSVAETEVLIESCEKRTILKHTKSFKALVGILNNIRELKVQVKPKQEQLNEQLRLVEST